MNKIPIFILFTFSGFFSLVGVPEASWLFFLLALIPTAFEQIWQWRRSEMRNFVAARAVLGFLFFVAVCSQIYDAAACCVSLIIILEAAKYIYNDSKFTVRREMVKICKLHKFERQ